MLVVTISFHNCFPAAQKLIFFREEVLGAEWSHWCTASSVEKRCLHSASLNERRDGNRKERVQGVPDSYPEIYRIQTQAIPTVSAKPSSCWLTTNDDWPHWFQFWRSFFQIVAIFMVGLSCILDDGCNQQQLDCDALSIVHLEEEYENLRTSCRNNQVWRQKISRV